jgi:hypothetical protein
MTPEMPLMAAAPIGLRMDPGFVMKVKFRDLRA